MALRASCPGKMPNLKEQFVDAIGAFVVSIVSSH